MSAPHRSSRPRGQKCRAAVLPLAILLFAAPCATGRAAERLDRANLLTFRAAGGEIAPVKSVADWRQRRADILAAAQEIMGPLPGAEKRGPLEMRIEEEIDAGAYVQRLISYAAEPGGRTPAYLLIPKPALAGGVKARAVLALHPTDHALGHKVAVGLGGKANRAYGKELAERGFVVLAPAYPLLANHQPDIRALGYESGTMKAIWDNIRGLDLLATLPFVHTDGFAAIGHSLGGHNAVYTAVFDERIKVVVSSCGLDSFVDYYGGDLKNWQPERGWCQTRYMPRLAQYAGRQRDIPFDFHELIGALAPRACFISAPLRDSNFQWPSVDRIAAAARPVYALHGQPQRLRVEHPDCDHDFPETMRQAAYEFIDTALANP